MSSCCISYSKSFRGENVQLVQPSIEALQEFAIRVYQRHAVGLTYQLAGRSADYLELPDETRSRARVGVFYTFLGSGDFGAQR